TTWNEFFPISTPITAIVVLTCWDMACSSVLAPLPSFACWRGRSPAGPPPYPTPHLITWCNHQALGSLASGKNSCWPQTLLRAWRARLRAVFPVAGLRSVRANPSRIAAGKRACQSGAEPSLAASQLGSACYHVPACPPEHPSCLPLIA